MFYFFLPNLTKFQFVHVKNCNSNYFLVLRWEIDDNIYKNMQYYT